MRKKRIAVVCDKRAKKILVGGNAAVGRLLTSHFNYAQNPSLFQSTSITTNTTLPVSICIETGWFCVGLFATIVSRRPYNVFLVCFCACACACARAWLGEWEENKKLCSNPKYRKNKDRPKMRPAIPNQNTKTSQRPNAN